MWINHLCSRNVFSARAVTVGIFCFAYLIITPRYTRSSLSSLLIFTKSLSCSLSYKKFFSSSSVGEVGDWLREGAGDGPLMESVGNAARSFLGVLFVLFGVLFDDVDGSLWHSTSSIFSRRGEWRVSSLSQILFDGFSEKRRCGEIKESRH